MGRRDLTPRCLCWKHQNVPIELHGSWRENWFLKPNPSCTTQKIKELLQNIEITTPKIKKCNSLNKNKEYNIYA